MNEKVGLLVRIEDEMNRDATKIDIDLLFKDKNGIFEIKGIRTLDLQGIRNVDESVVF